MKTSQTKMAGLVVSAMMGLSFPALATEQMAGKEEANMQAQIERRLTHDPNLKNNHIDVALDNGVVTLKGKVDTEEERRRASTLAHVDGVVRVEDKLEVGSAGVKATVTDSAITAKLKAEYLADEALRDGDISVTTNNGVVTLEGTVPTESAHQKAVSLARKSDGVMRVADKLRLTAKKAPASH